MTFTDLSSRAQVHRLRAVAHVALAHYPVVVDRVRLVNHGFNTTFRVDAADDRRFALRLNVNSQRRPEWIAAEMAWQAALAAETDLSLPSPLATRDGSLTTSVWSADLDRDVPAVLYSWLAGRDLGDDVTVDRMHAVGRAMATLHDHAAGWTPPTGWMLPRYDEPLFGAPDRLSGGHPLLSDEQRDVFGEALAAARRHHDEMFAGAAPIALHADLHQWNVKWHRGRLSLFDFDDSGLGLPIQDLAISAYYVRRVDPALEAALHEGYTSRRPLPAGLDGHDIDGHYEANLATRNLVLANDVVTTLNREMRDAMPTYLQVTADRLRHWLDTGTFRFEPNGR